MQLSALHSLRQPPRGALQAFRDNPELLEVFIRRAGLEVLAREEDDDESGGGPQEIDCRVS